MEAISSQYTDGTYFSNHATWHSEDSIWKADKILNALHRLDIRPKSFADVGCGAGLVIQELAKHFESAEFVGYEPSPQAYQLCLGHQQAPNITYKQDDFFSNQRLFDCLLCVDVVEHIEDAHHFLRKLRQRGGYKIFHVPLEICCLSVLRDSMTQSRNRYGHIHFFTRKTCLELLKDCGYRILFDAYTPYSLDFPAHGLKSKANRFIRSITAKYSLNLASKLYGGFSLLVIAE